MRILQPDGFLARPADDQHIGPAIGVEIVDERQKIIRVLERIKRNGGIKIMAPAKVRPLVPIRTSDGIDLIVAVEVTESRAFGERPGSAAVVPRGRALASERGIPSRRIVDGLRVDEVDDVFGALLTLELTPPL